MSDCYTHTADCYTHTDSIDGIDQLMVYGVLEKPFLLGKPFLLDLFC